MNKLARYALEILFYVHSPTLQQHDATSRVDINTPTRKQKNINDTRDANTVLLESSKLWRLHGIYKFMLCTRNI